MARSGLPRSPPPAPAAAIGFLRRHGAVSNIEPRAGAASPERMRALTVIPGKAQSARLNSLDHVPGDTGGIRVSPVAVGVCGTDAEILAGQYGWAPPGRDRL